MDSLGRSISRNPEIQRPPSTPVSSLGLGLVCGKMIDISRQIRESGAVCFHSSDDAATIDVARGLGQVVKVDGIVEVQRLTPVDAEHVEKNRYGGIYGTEEFPFHSDLAHWYTPPRFLLLRCLCPTAEVATYVIRSRSVFGVEDVVTLKRALFRPRRRLDGRLTCLRLMQGDMYRWDPVFISPVNKLAADLRSRVLKRIFQLPKLAHVLSRAGECILLDNWAVLHGRSSVPSTAMHRRVERVYLDNVCL
jgi:L-asparagine oxygenase